MIIEVLERYDVPDIPTLDLPAEDGIPLETNWHRIQMNLLIDIVTQRWRHVVDFFAGGNMFVYYSLQQARNRDYKGPDFFIVKDVDSTIDRDKWVAWEENGRLPDLIVELMSPSTAQEDLTTKKDLYERTFRTPEYYAYDPQTFTLYGWRLQNMHYVALQPNREGQLWSSELDGWLGLWRGTYLNVDARWLRLFEADGTLCPTEGEAGRQRAEAERQRAEAAEAEAARLREELARLRGE